MQPQTVASAGSSTPTASSSSGTNAKMANMCVFEPFNPVSSSFDRWMERLKIWFRINQIGDGDKKDYLLHYMGGPTYDVLCNNLQNADPYTKSFDEIVALLRNHFNPAPLEILENFKFTSRKQLENESLSEYLMELEKLAKSCNFDSYLDKALRNQFVFGIRNRGIQSRLLEVRDLTLSKAKDIAFGMEMSLRGTEEMHGTSPRCEVQQVTANTKKISSTNNGQQRKCYRCGDTNHMANRCQHKQTVCSACGKRGHLQKVCLSRHNNRRQENTHYLEENDPKDVLHVSTVQNHAGKFLLNLRVGQGVLTFEVDTGSPVSLINIKDKQKHLKDIEILQTDLRLVSYSDNDINVLGKLLVTVVVEGRKLVLPLYVTKSNKHPLLGRDWLRALNLDFNRIFRSGTHTVSYCDRDDECKYSALNALLQKYPSVFSKEIGKVKGIQASLTVREHTKPVYIKARQVPFALA
ncbi:uncharacterized protein LOC121601010 [Anopheles merus]|uniref:uncharacterized protein LOC121601010 n=1 Tax=Anopheles merus TaxID=30066 RepID=UPI001BE411C0|nr:uncharacterized protein LOC121601010 [Anopheles merus]